MHSFIDVAAGFIIGLIILFSWLTVYEHIDNFIISGQNVTSFWAILSFLLLYAYPAPEVQTPSFEYHAAFSGVVFGLVSGHQQTFFQLQLTTDSSSMFSSQLLGRIFVAIPTMLAVKFCSKALAKWLLPLLFDIIGIPIRSSGYIPALKKPDRVEIEEVGEKENYSRGAASFFLQESYDVDSGIRFLQYAGLSWPGVALVPYIFSHLNL